MFEVEGPSAGSLILFPDAHADPFMPIRKQICVIGTTELRVRQARRSDDPGVLARARIPRTLCA